MTEPEALAAPVRLLIVDDHDLVRDLVAAHLTAQGGFSVETVPTLAAARSALAENGPFDLILLDFALPDSRSLAESADLVRAHGGRPVVLFSGMVRRETVNDALAKGFAGYIPKSTAARELAAALRQILDGKVWLPPGFDRPTRLPPPLDSLTPRELQVLGCIRAGAMNKEIAGRMAISEVTVKMHVRSICTKLRARNRTHAAIIAAELLPS
ncbi:response regulator transcription factor [Gemmobacter caeruleus]|uniref:response regulator transcription factor n=1 Tax=Gemmobacter caeruleus TaxID=2595004 RepID=UPI0011EE89A6|nr:response regulator transcription factor [Gemmobacter caeruleus]